LYGATDKPGGAKYKPHTGLVISDFIADFEIVCLRSLNQWERPFFIHYYLEGLGTEGLKLNTLGKELDQSSTSKAGRKLVEYGLFPLTEYFKG